MSVCFGNENQTKKLCLVGTMSVCFGNVSQMKKSCLVGTMSVCFENASQKKLLFVETTNACSVSASSLTEGFADSFVPFYHRQVKPSSVKG
jgi:hypothetical protein